MSGWDEFKKLFGIAPINIEKLNRAALKSHPAPNTATHKNDPIVVTEDFRQVMSWINAKAPIIFVTGKAGTGKTTLIRYIRDQFQGNTVVVAPTGVAALLVEGSTIHSFFRFPPRLVTVDDIKLIRDRKLYRKIRLLIIDEISMVRADIIDGIDKFLKLNRDSSEPFGGVQLLLVGDLFQLPPVIGHSEVHGLIMMHYESHYFFSAKIFQQCSMVSKELTRVFRQSDPGFIDILNRVRVAESIEASLPTLNQRCVDSENGKGSVITLACTNQVADSINDRELGRLLGPARTFIGEVTGKFAVENTRLPSPINLSLKIGAQVMFTKNAVNWVNGTMGTVKEIVDDLIRVEIINDNGKSVHDVLQVTWETFKYQYNEDEDKIESVSSGKYRQYPLMLAWAVTIHKSQGKTLEKVRIDLGTGAFDYGQVYVALSRCRSLEDIHLVRPIRSHDIKCDPLIKRFYSALSNIV